MSVEAGLCGVWFLLYFVLGSDFIHTLNTSSWCSRVTHNFAIDLVGQSCGGVNVSV